MSLTKNEGSFIPGAEAQIGALIFAVILIDSEGLIVSVNQSGEDLLRASAKRLTGQPVADVLQLRDTRVHEHLNHLDEALVARDTDIRRCRHPGERRPRLALATRATERKPGHLCEAIATSPRPGANRPVGLAGKRPVERSPSQPQPCSGTDRTG